MKRTAVTTLLAAATALLPLTSGSQEITASAAGVPHSVGSLAASVRSPASADARLGDGVATIYNTGWSGYAQVGNKAGEFTAVMAQWKVPKIDTKLPGNQYASDWVGIDGAGTNQTIVQAGIEEKNVNGKARYYAWSEAVPHLAVRFFLHIFAGDVVIVKVQEVAVNTWKLSVTTSGGATKSRTVSYTTPGEDAEAIHERPSICVDGKCHLPQLARTSNVDFQGVWASFSPPGQSPGWEYISGSFAGATLQRIFMVNHIGGTVIASPSAIPNLDNCFTVADGSNPPPTPTYPKECLFPPG